MIIDRDAERERERERICVVVDVDRRHITRIIYTLMYICIERTCRPAVDWKTPPSLPTSSPNTTHLSSASSATCIASFTACTRVSSGFRATTAADDDDADADDAKLLRFSLISFPVLLASVYVPPNTPGSIIVHDDDVVLHTRPTTIAISLSLALAHLSLHQRAIHTRQREETLTQTRSRERRYEECGA